MSAIPTTPKRFKNWLEKQTALPANVYLLGLDYHFCLGMAVMNKNDPDALKAAKRLNTARMKEFLATYAAWKKQN